VGRPGGDGAVLRDTDTDEVFQVGLR